MRLALVVALVGFTTTVSSAQAPRITPRGDPSVRNDTIYALAVDPADHPEETAIYLLDDGVIRLEADGRGTRTYRVVMQILRPEAVENYQELRFSWAPKHQRFTLNWARVVRPNGTVVSARPTQQQESDVPAQRGDPVYSDTKVLRASLSGVEAGTIVDYSWTEEELKPFLPGDAMGSWAISTGVFVRRSRYIVDVPSQVELMLDEQNLRFTPERTVVGRRRVYRWVDQDVPRIRAERFAADSNGVAQSVTWALPSTWGAIGAWYESNARSRYGMGAAVEAKLAELVRNARTLDDSLRAVHKYAAQDVRYISVALGLGGYQPRSPDEVLSTGFGDCKDKATIFVSMLRRMGLEAYPVILNSTGGVIESLPSLTQFDHAIAAFKRPGSSRWEFTDLTALYTPFGELPFGPQGEFGIIVKSDGSVEEVTLPLTPVSENRMEVRLRGEIDVNGRVKAEFEEVGHGNQQYESRDAFANPYDSTQRARVADGIASRWFTGGRGADLVLPDGKDLTAPPRVTMRITDGAAVNGAGLLRLNLPTMEGVANLVNELTNAPPRQYPISAQSIFGYSQASSIIELTLPEGWVAQLPPSVEVDDIWGTYWKRYSQEGRVLRIERFASGKTGRYPPERIGELIEFLRKLSADDASTLVIRR